MAVTLDDLKLNLRIDGNEDDTILQNELNAAVSFVKNAICGGDNDTDAFFERVDVQPLFDNAVLALASTYYENRVSVSELQTYTIDAPLNSIIGTLRGIYDVNEEVDDNEKNQS